MSHTIVHKMANGGVGNYPPNVQVLSIMTGSGLGWDEERIAWEAYKFTIPYTDPDYPENNWPGFSDELAYDWCLALGNGSLTEAQALELFARRTQLRRGYLDNAVIDTADLPEEIKGDRYFREAVVWDDTSPNKCRCDMPKARGIHMDKIRVQRNAELVKKDLEILLAIEVGNTSDQTRIAAEKVTLRQIPQTFDLTTDPDAPVTLAAKWPDGLPRLNDDGTPRE